MIKVLLSLILVALLSVGGYLFLNQPEQPEPPVEEPPHVHEYVVSVIKPTCTDKGYTMNTCSECGYVMCDTLVDVAPEAHSWKVTNVIDSTCTALGTRTYTCEYCSLEKNEEIAMIPHAFGEWAEITAPTCTEEGEEGRACEVCSLPETRPVKALGHSYDEGVVTAPTCTEQGYTTYTCGVCAEVKTGDEVKATGHAMGEWVLEEAPTCVAEGLNVKYCQNGCGHTESEKVEMLAHDWDDGKVTEPTCVAPGYTVYSCKACYTTKTETGDPALSHELGDWYVKTAPKCEEIGEERRDCVNCDYYISREIAATGHDLADWATHIAPTCTEAGEDRMNCKNCDYYESKTTDAIGHKYGDNWTTHVDSTCTEEGEARNYCENGCGEYETKVIATHHYDVVTDVAPTCTEEGIYEILCRDCGDHRAEVIPALGHTHGDWHEVGNSGQEMRECSTCGAVEVRTKE